MAHWSPLGRSAGVGPGSCFSLQPLRSCLVSKNLVQLYFDKCLKPLKTSVKSVSSTPPVHLPTACFISTRVSYDSSIPVPGISSLRDPSQEKTNKKNQLMYFEIISNLHKSGCHQTAQPLISFISPLGVTFSENPPSNRCIWDQTRDPRWQRTRCGRLLPCTHQNHT